MEKSGKRIPPNRYGEFKQSLSLELTTQGLGEKDTFRYLSRYILLIERSGCTPEEAYSIVRDEYDNDADDTRKGIPPEY